MLNSRKLYRLARTILAILTILSMLGISTNIFADGLSVLEKMRLFTNDIYDSLEDYQKACILENQDNFNFIYYNPTSRQVMMRNITTLSDEESNNFKYYSPGISKVSNSSSNCNTQNVSSNVQTYGYNNSYVYKFTADNSNYTFVYKNTFNVNINIIGNGDVIGGGVYNQGENVNLLAEPQENNAFVGWFADSELLDLISNDVNYTIENIDNDYVLYAQFIEVGGGGSDDPNTPDNPTIYDNETYKYNTALLIVVCMFYWNNIIKEYL